MFEDQLDNLPTPVDWKRHEAFVPSFHEMYPLFVFFSHKFTAYMCIYKLVYIFTACIQNSKERTFHDKINNRY